ncbi:MAG: hypothetical protein ACREQM_15640 [Candidatus Dormibacteraceae bacterium]
MAGARFPSGRRLMIVVAATRLEARAARRALRGSGVEVVRVGVGGGWVPALAGGSPIVVTGLCGALLPMAPGTVVVPDEVSEPGGPVLRCDRALVGRLRAAAVARGWAVAGGRQLTAPAIVRGADRARWAAAGFETVDMEAARVLSRGGEGAVVRVVLDTPGHELPPPAGLIDPRRWRSGARIARSAPGFARRASEVVAAILGG